jgi:hypothetical protein
MLFPKSVEVARIWKQVVANAIDNRLGCTCKVATDDGKDERLSKLVLQFTTHEY